MRLRLRSLTGVLPEPAIAKFPVRAIGVLIALATAESAFGSVIAAIAELPAIVAIAVLAARSVAVIPVAPVTAEILAIAPVIAIVVIVALIAIVPRLAVFVAVLIIEIARLLLLIRLLLRLRRFARRLLLLRLDAELVALVITELIAVAALGTGQSMRAGSAVAERISAALLRHLLAIAQDDAVIVLGVLKIVFREDGIAG